MKEKCRICNGGKSVTVYDGKIRSAGAGSAFVKGYKILRCRSCNADFLSPVPENIKELYESNEYRRHYDYTVNEAKLAEKYDVEQNDRIHKIGMENLRGRTVGDFGCGTGLFLDAVKGIVKKAAAIEPMKNCEAILKRKGYAYFKYPEKVRKESLDLAFTFDTLEHVYNPVSFLESVHNSLKKGGYLYLSVPNRNDILMNVCKEAFQQFFYCKAHLFYYDIGSLVHVLEKAGFSVLERSGLHKYDFYNFINWLKTGRPSGRKKLDYIDSFFEANFKGELVRMNMASHLFLKAVKA